MLLYLHFHFLSSCTVRYQLKNRWCTYINCVYYLSTSSVITLLQSLVRVLYYPVMASLFLSLLRLSPTGPVVSMVFVALDH